jgi:hypothetical protein
MPFCVPWQRTKGFNAGRSSTLFDAQQRSVGLPEDIEPQPWSRKVANGKIMLGVKSLIARMRDPGHVCYPRTGSQIAPLRAWGFPGTGNKVAAHEPASIVAECSGVGFGDHIDLVVAGVTEGGKSLAWGFTQLRQSGLGDISHAENCLRSCTGGVGGAVGGVSRVAGSQRSKTCLSMSRSIGLGR